MKAFVFASFFGAAICALATEQQISCPPSSDIVQGHQFKKIIEANEGGSLYLYFATSTISYIEENFSSCGLALHIRYLYDEDESFVAALCRLSTLSVLSNEWTHSRQILTSGEILHIERLGISERIDERAKRVMLRCHEDLPNQEIK